MLRVAVVGATGLVGSQMMAILEERSFPVAELVPVASERSAGKRVSFRGEEVEVRVVSEEVFEGVDLALFSAGSSVSRRWAPVAVSRGAVVVDNSSAWRMDPKVPLVVPEINGDDLSWHSGIIANPNCATVQTLMALYPLHRRFGLVRFFASTYQSVSGTGARALEELRIGALSYLDGRSWSGGVYPHPIAFNLIPEIGPFRDDGYSEEELKMVNESRKIMGLPDLQVDCTTVRVPVFRGHSVSVFAFFQREVDVEEARGVLSSFPGVKVVDDPSSHLYPMPMDAAGRDEVFVGRIRRSLADPRGLALWVVSDNVRKGAALNAVQISEKLLEMGLLRRA